jgi:hypothetical protein
MRPVRFRIVGNHLLLFCWSKRTPAWMESSKRHWYSIILGWCKLKLQWLKKNWLQMRDESKKYINWILEKLEEWMNEPREGSGIMNGSKEIQLYELESPWLDSISQVQCVLISLTPSIFQIQSWEFICCWAFSTLHANSVDFHLLSNFPKILYIEANTSIYLSIT